MTGLSQLCALVLPFMATTVPNGPWLVPSLASPPTIILSSRWTDPLKMCLATRLPLPWVPLMETEDPPKLVSAWVARSSCSLTRTKTQLSLSSPPLVAVLAAVRPQPLLLLDFGKKTRRIAMARPRTWRTASSSFLRWPLTSLSRVTEQAVLLTNAWYVSLLISARVEYRCLPASCIQLSYVDDFVVTLPFAVNFQSSKEF